jgi:hypothetical protein
MNYSKTITIILSVLLFITSYTPHIIGDKENTTNQTTELILINTNDIHQLKHLESLQARILETYEQQTLVEIDSSKIIQLEKNNYSFHHLPHQSRLYINGYEFDINTDEPNFPVELSKTEYEANQQGLYIVHMIGPIAKHWRPTLEQMNVQVLHYLHNYAYKVLMTPEQSKDVFDLYFVDWVSIFHPFYKLEKDLSPGLVTIGLVPGANGENLANIWDDTDVVSFIETIEGYRLVSYVGSEKMLYELANKNEVSYIQRYSEPVLHAEIDSQIIGGGAWILDDDNDPTTPYRAHGDHGAYINQRGYTGEGVVIAIADSGLGDGTIGDAGHPDFAGRVLGGYYWSGSGWQDGHGHGSHCAGSAAGDTYGGTGVTYAGHGPYYISQGIAYESELYSAKIFSDDESWSGPDDYYEIVKVAKQNADAYVHSNSWGYSNGNGSYAVSDNAYDQAVRDADNDTSGNQPMVITVAAGNSGPSFQSVGSPGNAKNVITVGATESYMPDSTIYGNTHNNGTNPNNVTFFSSRGWTADNRVKPDVVATGQAILSTSSPNVAGSNLYGIYTEDSRYEWCSGTSMSNPAVAGAAAVVVHWYEVNFGLRPSPAMVKALLINTAQDLDDASGNTDPIPNRDEGWGMVDISKLQYPYDDPVSFYLRDQEHVFTESGQSEEYLIMSDRDGVPLKVSLVWTDKEAPSGTGSGRTLVNDLHLEVESPSGLVYRGNAFSDGWTVAGAEVMDDFDYSDDGWDDTNTVENVYIHPDDGELGIYTVRVIADNIVDDATNVGNNSQDFALAIYNAKNQLTQNPPFAFSATSVNRTTIRLDWTNVGNNNTYIEYNTTIGPWNRGEAILLENSTNTTYNHSGLSFNTTYYYQAWSYNTTTHKYSDDSTSSQAKTKENLAPLLANEHPTNQSSDNNVSIQWNVTITDPEADRFNWNINCSNGNNTQTVNDYNGSKTLSLSNLNYETEYTIWVNATDKYGAETKAWYTFTTKDEPWENTCPSSTFVNPANKSKDIDVSIGQWSVDITDLDGNTTNGSIKCSNADSMQWSNESNGTRILQLNILDYNTNYTIYLNYTDGHCIVNETFWFITRDQYDPIQPEDFTAETQNRFRIDLSWIPTDDFTYIEYNTTNSWLRGEGEFLQNDTSQSFQHIGLNPETTYYYQAWSYNTTDNTWSTCATDFNSTLSNQAPLFTNLNPLNESNDQQRSFTWMIDINDSEGDKFNWSIECNNSQENSSTEEINGTKQLVLTDLAYSTQYTVWVNATDEYGAETKEWYTFITKKKPWQNTCPESSDEVPANKSIDVSITLSTWSVNINDTDGNITHGSIHCSNGDQIEWFDQANGTQSLMLSALEYNTNYTIWLNYTDGHCIVNETFWFITEPCYSLTITIQGNGTVEKTPDLSCYPNGTTVELNATADIGWEFSHWSGDILGGENPIIVSMTNDYDITAVFTRKGPFTLYNTTSGTGSGMIQVHPIGPYYYGDMVTVWANASQGSNFTGFNGNLTGTETPQNLIIDGNKSINAQFTLNNYQLTINSTNGGSVINPGVGDFSYNHGSTITLEARSIIGYHFVEWTGDNQTILDTKNNLTTMTIQNHSNITAEFARNGPFTLTLTTNGTGSGSIEVNKTGPYYYNDTVTVWANASIGSTFTGFSGDLQGTSSPQTIVITENKTVNAEFTLDCYQLNINIIGTGDVSCDPNQTCYTYNTKIKLTPNAEFPWYFSEWTGPNATDLVNNEDGSWNITILNDTELTATFLEQWVNTCPFSTSESPTNKSTGTDIELGEWSVFISDLDGNITNGTITCSNEDFMQWTNHSNGSRILDLTNLNYNTNYTIWLNYTDGHCIVNETFWFITRDQYDPIQPEDFTAETQNRFRIDLSWIPSDDFTYIEYNTTSSWLRGKGEFLQNDTTSSYQHVGLNPGTTYYYQAWSFNSTDNAWSTCATDFNNTISNQPPSFTNPSPGNESDAQGLFFTWIVDINDSEGDKFNWSIECNNSQENNSIEEINGTKQLVLTDLAYSTQYTVWVNATDEYGAETKEWYIFNTKDEPWENTCPVSSSVNPANESIDVDVDIGQWSVDITDVDGNTSSGSIHCSNGNSTIWNDTPNGTQSLNLTLLDYNTKYTIYLNYTDGHCLVNETFWFIIRDQFIPNPPINFKAASLDRFQMNLSWTKADNADFIIVECEGEEIYNGTGNHTIHTGLLPNSTYQYQARSYNLTDQKFSEIVTDQDTTKVNYPPDFYVTDIENATTNTALSIEWNMTIADVEGDTFNWSIECNNSQNNNGIHDTNGTKKLVLSGLAYSTQYRIWVNATDEYGAETKEWYTFITKKKPWQNSCPESISVTPTNTSEDVSINIGQWSVDIADADGNSTSGSIHCSNGQDTNWSNQENGTQTLDLGSLNYNTKYTIYLNYTDGHCLVNETFWFITAQKQTGGNTGGGGSSSGTFVPTPKSPVANVTVDKIAGVVGEMFRFNASGSVGGVGDIINYSWDFGDGTVVFTNESLITHEFSFDGSFEVMLRVTDEAGITDSLDTPLMIEIIQANNPPRDPMVTVESTFVHQGAEVFFTMSAVDPDVNDTLRFEIDWDDETTFISDHIYESNETFSTSHQWDSFGVYTIKVTAFDEDNASSETKTISMFVDVRVIDDEINGWLIDTDSDGVFDVFKNLNTNKETIISIQDDSHYYIDMNDDGEWEYSFNPVTNQLSLLSTSSPQMDREKEQPFPWWGFVLIIALIILMLIGLLFYKGILYIEYEEE